NGVRRRARAPGPAGRALGSGPAAGRPPDPAEDEKAPGDQEARAALAGGGDTAPRCASPDGLGRLNHGWAFRPRDGFAADPCFSNDCFDIIPPAALPVNRALPP